MPDLIPAFQWILRGVFLTLGILAGWQLRRWAEPHVYGEGYGAGFLDAKDLYHDSGVRAVADMRRVEREDE